MDVDNLLALSSTEIVKWCKEQKAKLKVSNQIVAEKSCVPQGTVDRIFSGHYSEFKYNSVQPIIVALLELGATLPSGENIQDADESVPSVNPYEAKDPDGTGHPISMDTDYQIAQQRHLINRLRAEVEFLRIENERKYEQLQAAQRKNEELHEMINNLLKK